MPWWTWVALGVFVSAVVGGGLLALLAFRTLGALRSVSVRLSAALEDLAAKSEELERRGERASESVEAAQPHFDHLRATVERFSVLTWALGDAAKTVAEVRSALLVRK